MKKRLILFLAVCLLSVCSNAWAVVYGRAGYENEGYSEATAWEIDSAAVLAKFRDDVNNDKLNYEYYVKLTKDIDLTSYKTWTPIGGTADSLLVDGEYASPFRGHFNGDGHTIKVKISEIAQDRSKLHHGLFGIIARGSIKNLNVEGTVEAYMRAEAQEILVGGIASIILGGSIENCKFNGSVRAYNQGQYANETYAGGIVALAGYSYQSYYYGTVSVKNCKTGSKSDTAISATCNTASDWQYGGSIVGYIHGSNCEITGNYGRATFNGTSICCIYGGRRSFEGIVEDNTEADPSDPPPDAVIAPKITTSSLNAGTVGTSYSVQLTASGTTPITYSLSSGTLPGGLKLTKTGKISGTPTKAGTFTIKIKAKNSAGSNTKTFTLTIKAKAVKPTITTTSLANGVRGKSYSVTLKSNPSGAKWSKSSGTLPTGLKLTSAGKLSGTPTKAGNFTFTVKATANGLSSTKKFTVKVTQTTVTATIPATIVKGASYTWTPKASGGTSAYKWSKSSGTLPTGMKINASTGKITGKPTKAGTFKFTIKAVDKNKIAGTKAFTVKVIAAKVDLESAISNIAIKGSAFSGYVLASNGTAPYTWSISSGKLPTGLKLTSSSTKATIKGTPTKTGTFTFTVKAVDKNKASATVKITVLVIDISSLAGTAGKSAQTAEPSSSKTTEQKSSSSKSSLQTAPLDLSTGSNTDVNIRATLSVASDDVVESYEGKDSDMIKVKADKPLTFIIGKWPEEVESVTVYVDDKAVDGVKVTEGVFTLPPELVHNDFKVSVKSGKQESEELFIIAE